MKEYLVNKILSFIVVSLSLFVHCITTELSGLVFALSLFLTFLFVGDNHNLSEAEISSYAIILVTIGVLSVLAYFDRVYSWGFSKALNNMLKTIFDKSKAEK